jgi:hypothetical protein
MLAGKEVLVICESGGSIDAVPGNSQVAAPASLLAHHLDAMHHLKHTYLTAYSPDYDSIQITNGYQADCLDDSRLIMLCSLVSQGKQSRSLKAIYYLQRAGITNVAHISGGLSQWVRDGLPVKEAGDDEDEDGDEGQSAEGSKGLSLVGSLLGGRQRGG